MAAMMQQPSIIGQLIIDTYTISLLGFQIPVPVSHGEVIETLDQAALKLTDTFPFLGGQVVLEGRDATNTGIYRTIPYEPHNGKSPVRVKDCRELLPSFDEISKARAPASMLDGDILSPMKGFPNEYDVSATEMPVVIIQANFITGGLLLCFACMHNAIDMNGQGQLIRHFATACRGEELSKADIELGNCNPNDLIPLLRNGEKPLAHVEMRVPSRLGGKTALSPAVVPAPWTCFRFPQAKLVQLKAEASKSLTDDVKYISTNDALTALFWQRLTIVQQARLPTVEDVTLLRAVNGRRVVNPPIPEGFMGHYVFICGTNVPVQDLITAPLSILAVELRRAIQKVDDYYVRSLATLIKTEDRSTFSYGALMKSGMDVLTSSFADLGVLQCGFGPLLGRARFARRPRLPDAENLSYLMPRTVDGDLDLMASLREEDIEALENDAVWKEYTELIG